MLRSTSGILLAPNRFNSYHHQYFTRLSHPSRMKLFCSYLELLNQEAPTTHPLVLSVAFTGTQKIEKHTLKFMIKIKPILYLGFVKLTKIRNCVNQQGHKETPNYNQPTVVFSSLGFNVISSNRKEELITNPLHCHPLHSHKI